MEHKSTNTIHIKDLNEEKRFLLQKKIRKRLKRKANENLEDTIKDLENEYGKEKASITFKSILKKIMRKKHTKYGGNIQGQNNIPQDNISLSPGSSLIQNPHQYNVAIDQTDGGTVFAPSMVGNTIQGHVTMNLHVPQSQSVSERRDKILQEVKDEIKAKMKSMSGKIIQGMASSSSSLDQIYTELFIISDESDPINREHEIWQIETHDLSTSTQKIINYKDILLTPDNDETVKTVLTKGIAGIGKTVTVQKFVHDWANGGANQDLEFVFLLPFRELNLLEGEESLFDVLCIFHPEFRKARQISEWICERKVLFILDGLDEYKKPLDFKSRIFSSVTEAATVDVLLVNLLRRKMFPSAHLWITSRPVAVEQLPSEIFLHGHKTQIRGFRDEQKEEFFYRQFEEPALAREIICHLKSKKSLWILCHIPLFCWISSVVLKDIKSHNKDGSMPTNLTEMYIHYLLVQTGLSHWKYEELSQCKEALLLHKELILKLAKLAYWELKEQNINFKKEDLGKYNVIVDEATQYPGVITCVSDCSFGYIRTQLFSFIHLSVQEFFAALFAFHEFLSGNQDSLKLHRGKSKQSNFFEFLKSVINAALSSKNGHLDLFSRFIFGISCDSSISLLTDVLPPLCDQVTSGDHKRVTGHIKSLKRKGLSSERCISLVHCLMELKDRSFLQDMQKLERSRSPEPLTLFQCTVLAYKFVMSDTKQEEFDLRKYNITLEGFQRFCPAIRCFRRALLKGSGLTEQHCASLKGYLSSPNSHLTEIDLSHSGLRRAALTHLTTALRQPDCQIHTLILSHNQLQSHDMELVRDVLLGENMNLKVLDLSDNPLEDSGARTISSGLRSANCRLQVLKLSGCQIEAGAYDLVSSVKANSYLRELDLRYNHLGQGIIEAERSSLRILTGGECSHQTGLDKYAVSLTFDPQTANDLVHLNESNTVATRQKEKLQLPAHDKRFDKCNQVLCHQPLRERSYFMVDVIGRDVYVGVACEGMKRKGAGHAVLLGHNEMSWSLRCSDKVCVAHHKGKTVNLETETVRRLAVFVDREAGSVCFYTLSPQFELLYMFDADFPKDGDLYAGFRLQDPGSAVHLKSEIMC